MARHANTVAETQDHKGRMFTCRNGIAQVVTRYSLCELSNVSHEMLFFEYDLARINSTIARAPFVNHVPSLPRTQARGTCRLVLSSSVFAKAGARIQATHAVFVLPHLKHALFHWYTENLGELCSLGRACDLWVVARSVIHAQVAGAASIAHASEETHFS